MLCSNNTHNLFGNYTCRSTFDYYHLANFILSNICLSKNYPTINHVSTNSFFAELIFAKRGLIQHKFANFNSNIALIISPV